MPGYRELSNRMGNLLHFSRPKKDTTPPVNQPGKTFLTREERERFDKLRKTGGISIFRITGCQKCLRPIPKDEEIKFCSRKCAGLEESDGH